MRRGSGTLAVAAIDFLCCLLLVVLVRMGDPKATPPRINTYGVYAIVVSWPDRSNDDVDAYVQDPAGQIAYFANPDAGLMHLEHDDLGVSNDQEGAATVAHNGERVVLRGFVAGEYVANVHMYAKNDPGPTRVDVQLWRLRGRDELVAERTVTLAGKGDEVTAFRFTLNGAGVVTDRNELPKKLVDAAVVP